MGALSSNLSTDITVHTAMHFPYIDHHLSPVHVLICVSTCLSIKSICKSSLSTADSNTVLGYIIPYFDISEIRNRLTDKDTK